MPRGKRGITIDEFVGEPVCKFLALMGACTVIAFFLFIFYHDGFILGMLLLIPVSFFILIIQYSDEDTSKEFAFYLFFILMVIGALGGPILVIYLIVLLT